MADALDVDQATVSRDVQEFGSELSHIRAKVDRLTRLGWTQDEVADALEVSRQTVDGDAKEFGSELSGIRAMVAKGVTHADVAGRFRLPDQLVWAAALDHRDGTVRLKPLGIKVQPYDVWNFHGCHDLMGDLHTGTSSP
ncbi:MAG: hypothetical protein ACR2JF_06250 [Iamia sp.]